MDNLVDEVIEIGEKKVGKEHPTFIIAEAGVNHNGKLGLAKELVDEAKKAGVDAVKFQTFKAEDLVTKEGKMADYQKKNLGEEKSQYEMIKERELGYDEFEELKRYCDEKGILFLSTPHTEEAADFLEELVPVFKIGSGDLTNLPFLEKIAKKGKPMILSTGMGTLGEVEEAVGKIKGTGNEDLILLHCVTDYPASIEDINLNTMLTLSGCFKTLVGYSDHTLGITVPLAAVSLGATVIEKHFTLDKKMKGPDHKASLEPEELKEMVHEIRSLESALGDGIKRPTQNEEEIKKVARKSIVAGEDIPQGSVLKEDMLDIKRPGFGIKPKHLERLIGRGVKRDIKEDELITWDMIK
ncbi:MAG: N-acetylneuraminate synthase [Candidatus Natronoplasma sp.]